MLQPVRDIPRPRRPVSRRRARWLRVLGFRYSDFRDAYVLRLIGERYGPVYQVQREPQPGSGGVVFHPVKAPQPPPGGGPEPPGRD